MNSDKPQIGKLTAETAKRLGSGWRSFRNDCCARTTDCLLQGVYFNPSRDQSDFVPQYFVMALPIPEDTIILTIGDRLKDSDNRDYWMQWTRETLGCAKQITTLIQEQACPSVGEPLDIESMLKCVAGRFASLDHFLAPWTLGILHGLNDNGKASGEYFERALHHIAQRQEQWTNAEKSPPEYFQKYKSQIEEFVRRLENLDIFRQYCLESACKTKQMMGLI